MSMLDDIIAWCQSIPEWQADAVRRMLAQDELTSADKDELYLMLKADFGLLTSGQSALRAVRPQPGIVSGAPASQSPLALHAIENVRNVNAIPDGSSLHFGVTGLTVVYGQNGSGKSGYARVLKRACKARDTEERILPNVLPASPPNQPSRPAQADIKVQIGAGAPQTLPWTDGQHHDVLMNAAVFDSSCARIIVDNDCDVSYLPYGADVFKRLGDLMTEFKERLEREKPAPLPPQVRDVVDGTKSDAFLKSLSSRTSVSETGTSCAWSATDDHRLGVVTELLLKDPNVMAAQIDTKRLRLELLRTNLATLDSLVSDVAVQALHQLHRNLDTAIQVAETFATSLGSEPLSGVGSEVWRALYEAAKEYSTSQAYPSEEFPHTGEDALCVLCMQPLLPDARRRMTQFKSFMIDKTASAAAVARNRLNSQLGELSRAKEVTGAAFADAIETLDSKDPTTAMCLTKYLAQSAIRLQTLRATPRPDSATQLPVVPPAPVAQLDEVVRLLTCEARDLRQQAQPGQRVLLTREKDELQSRKALTGRKADVSKYVLELATMDKFVGCAQSLNTLAVSSKGKAMVTNALTPGFKARLKDELVAMDAAYLPVLPTPTASAGTTRHRLCLSGMQKSTRASISEVLSEGEHRVVAIAGFLAELAASGHTGPIVFDDPVSSLDHVFRDHIATRLVEEATRRQVIVFTHDISLLLELEFQAEKDGSVQWVAVTVSRRGPTPGYTKPGLPSEASSYGSLLTEIRSELEVFAGDFERDRVGYSRKAAALYDRLRGALEIFVEEVLLNNVVRRHNIMVSVDRLKAVECTTIMYKEIQLAYTECGRWGAAHSNARPLSAERPKPGDVRDFITKLEKLATDTKKHKKELELARKVSLAPRLGKTG